MLSNEFSCNVTQSDFNRQKISSVQPNLYLFLTELISCWPNWPLPYLTEPILHSGMATL